MYGLVMPASSIPVLGDDVLICYLAQPFSAASMPVAGLDSLRCINTAPCSKGAWVQV